MAERGWTYRETANRLGVSQTSVGNYLQGIALPGPDIQERLAEATGSSLETMRELIWRADNTAIARVGHSDLMAVATWDRFGLWRFLLSPQAASRRAGQRRALEPARVWVDGDHASD